MGASAADLDEATKRPPFTFMPPPLPGPRPLVWLCSVGKVFCPKLMRVKAQSIFKLLRVSVVLVPCVIGLAQCRLWPMLILMMPRDASFALRKIIRAQRPQRPR